MLTDFKYQVMQMVQPEEIFLISAKHLDTMQQMIAGEDAKNNLNWARDSFSKMCCDYNAYDY